MEAEKRDAGAEVLDRIYRMNRISGGKFTYHWHWTALGESRNFGALSPISWEPRRSIWSPSGEMSGVKKTVAGLATA